MDTALAAETEKERAAQHIAEADDARKSVDRDSRDDIALAFRDDRFALLPQIRSLRLDVKCVEELFHGFVAKKVI